jgi:uncharacterized protein YodC (DUF2158 family)
MYDLKKGDQVVLNNPGPNNPYMNITEIMAGTGNASCTWFDGKGELKVGVFPLEMLRKIDLEDPFGNPDAKERPHHSRTTRRTSFRGSL